ncbi:putative inactive cadmium/zinc-transporting ATPase HMA3 isoform X2 [Vigna radiata var. radiata]|uniref:Inactive cadmium/zinc-transporting ATPase HMA3 isoform X2 n=1 Tax=Vigna radiata var. radiata TaxID=3916 RepID=A0A1S3UTP6_VIGRR|nr:putative inactive cadmium/zinc-transporting ATPase HMA3 isoform X2 [Vigna radiata var. radiata]
MESKKLQKSYFDVLGLCCSSEVPLIENILKPLQGIKEVSVIVPSRTVIVLHDTLVISQLQIVKALNQARLEANIRVHGDENHGKRWPSPYSIASGVLLLVSFLKFVYPPLKYVALGAVAAGIYPIFRKAIASIRNLRVDISILMIIAVTGTIAMRDYLEAGTIVFLFSIAEWLESRASHKATAAMSSLMNIAPQKAVIADSGEVVDADEVKLNTILAVKAGEVIPIDGVVLDGTCEVDEKTLTGESFPVAKQKDSTVWAGTINLNGYISVKTTALAEDCVVAKMTKLVEEAQNSKTNVQTLIEKFVKFYTPAVVIISTLVAVIPLALKSRREKYWFHSALVVLVSACPCALILSTPVATFCAYTRAATSGLLIKGGHHLETLAKIKVMAFDKTGTITKGDFVVTEFQSLSDDIDLNTLLFWVSSVESKSSHPLASAIVDYGRSLSVEPEPEKVTEFENFPGEGISGKMDDKVIYIGNKKIAARAGSETVPILQGENARGKTTGYIYLGATAVGFFSLSDVCRLGVEEAIGQLKLMGIKTAMLTGDSESAAMQAQEQLGHSLELVHAELLPEDKVKIISEFKKEGPTAMIGDGINDAPALASADIGISMGISGSALASETGNIILMSNDIKKIPEAIKLARKTRWKVLQNIILSITTKAAIIGLAIGGYPYVWAAVVADVGTCLVVILNSMLLLPRGHKHGGKSCRSSTKSHNHKSGCAGTHGHDHAHHQHQHCHDQNGHDHHQHEHCHDQNGNAHHQHQHCHDQKGHDHHQHQHCHDQKEHDHHHHQHKHEHDHHHLDQHDHGHDHHQPQHEHDHHDHTDNHNKSVCHPDNEKNGTGEISVDIIADHVESAPMKGCSSLAEKEKGSCCEGCSDTCENLAVVCGCESSKEGEDSACCRNECSSKACNESPIIHVCVGLDKREYGGCCKSYMKECCGKLGHSRTGFVGGLSEIMTE